MDKLRGIFCKIGVHKYGNEYRQTLYDHDEQLGYNKHTTDITRNHIVRDCQHCGKKQYVNIHCLGLNPYKHTRTWVDLK